MSEPSAESSSRFAHLRPSSEARPEAGPLAGETEKLESLKSALFVAFEQAPRTGIPTGLVDLVSAYTNALRLQLTLMGYRALPQRTRASAQTTPHASTVVTA